MAELTRFGVSIEKQLLDMFDDCLKENSYETRSKAISDLIQEYINNSKRTEQGVMAGAITFIYDHHNKDLVSKLLEIQHNFHDAVISMQHIHMDHNNCLEILAIRADANEAKSLFNQIRALKGINIASINVTNI